MSSTTKRMSLVILIAAFAGLTARALGDSYIDRLPDHDGLYLVAADNTVARPPLATPARTIVIVVDGLREDAARGMRSVATLDAAGQCHSTNAGNLTVSRPVYTVLSSGLEADRAGARNNDDTSPVAVESIWEVARAAHLEVHATSELLWWQQLFPGGFDRYLVVESSDNAFERAELADLTLIHPVYVDEAGHAHGGSSRPYAEAVSRVDEEISAFLAGHVALHRDLVVLTADHGHTDRGGHGGRQRSVSRVLTCFAGVGVARRDGATLDTRTIAPTLSVLLGIPFPRHMRAGDDDLDAMWDIVDDSSLGADYADDRAADIDAMRAANRTALAAWLDVDPDEARWSDLYESRGRRDAALFASLVIIAMLGLFASMGLRRLGWRRSILLSTWMLATLGLSTALYVAVRGSFDFTSINRRALFIYTSLICCGAVTLVACVVHVALWRALDQLAIDLVSLAVAMTAIDLAHPVAYGWRMGFPLPGPAALFVPFFAASVIAALGVLAMIAAAGALLRERRAASRKG